MLSMAVTSRTAPGPIPEAVVSSCRRRGTVLLLGAAVVSLVVSPVGGADLYWMPLVLGLTYLLAAMAGGREGALWSAGLVVTSWAVAVLLVLTGTLQLDFAGAAVTGLGIGAVLASLLPRVGIPAPALSIAAPVLLVGVLELAQSQLHGPLDKGWAYGGLLALWGLWELRGAPDLTPAGPDTRRT